MIILESYKKVDVYQYVKEGLKNGSLNVIEAKKNAKVFARQGNLGEKVITWALDDFGNSIVEREDYVTLDENTHEPGWVVTKIDQEEKPVIDINNHTNQWIIRNSVFHSKYNGDFSQPGVFVSKGITQQFIPISENIQIIVKTGATMNISSGGYLNVTNPERISGISAKDFQDTYIKCEKENLSKRN